MELEEAGVRRGGRPQRFSVEQKRQIVEATLVPGASVALVARERGVNANQVFAWRKSYQQGPLGEERWISSMSEIPVGYASRRCSIGWSQFSSRYSTTPTSDIDEGDQRPNRFFDRPGNSFFFLEKRAYSLE